MLVITLVLFGLKAKTKKKRAAVATKAAPSASSEEEDMIPVSFISLPCMVNLYQP